jgi:glycosyltransferase involved in cell wall biosynthesis
LAARTDLVHLGEDLAILPVGAVAAELHRLPLVLTVHMSLRHTLVVTDFRSVVLKVLHADLLVLPSIYEELGTVLLEAM